MPISWIQTVDLLEGFEELTEDLVEAARIIVLILDADGRVVHFNAFLETITGYRLEEVVGACWFETFIPPADVGSIRQVFDRAIGGEATVGNVNPLLARDGTLKQIEWFDRAMHDMHGEVIGLLVMGRDLTAQIEVETRLRDSEERARAVFETVVNAVVTMDESRRICSVNPAVEQMFGYRSEELLGENVRILMPSPYREEHDRYVEDYLVSGRKKIIGVGREVLGRRRDGSVFPIDLSVGEARLADGSRLFTGIIRDLTERKRLEEKILEISEEEQRRIGRDIHDDLCQQLAGIGCLAQVVQQRLASSGNVEAEDMAEIVRLVSEANARAREMSRGLLPVIRESDGLVVALRELAKRTVRMFGVSCSFGSSGQTSVSDNKVATQIFRIAQEAVSNACRHSGATRIEVALVRELGRVVLRVTDNGSGMPDRDPGGAGGLGLLTMQHRAKMLGGDLRFLSAEGGGTTVCCRAPLGEEPAQKGELA